MYIKINKKIFLLSKGNVKKLNTESLGAQNNAVSDKSNKEAKK